MRDVLNLPVPTRPRRDIRHKSPRAGGRAHIMDDSSNDINRVFTASANPFYI